MVPALALPHAPPQAVATAPYAADTDRWRAVRANVRLFHLPESARAAGFRPCKRCRPDEMPGNLPEVAQVRQICAWIAEAEMAAPLAGKLAARAWLG